MDIQKVLAQVDVYFEENKGAEAETLMLESVALAVKEQDDDSLLQLLNELLGYYRETSQKENAMKMAEQAIAQAKRMGLYGTVPYATTLLNVATACRACGRLEESMEYYRQVQELYESQQEKGEMEPDSMYMASLKNNMSLLCQEMGDFAGAKEKLLEALAIVEKQNATYELGVTCANLAGTCAQLHELEEAAGYAERSLEAFRERNVTDSHYAAALSTLGACAYHQKKYEQAMQYYCLAMEAVEKNLGRNEYYRRLQENVTACQNAILKEGQTQDGTAESREQAERTAGSDGCHKGVGLALSREYYEAFGRPLIEEQFPRYVDKIAVGLVGRGSDCFGYDDDASRDHDWGPDFCMWVTDETYEEIGVELQAAYEQLPSEYKGYCRAPHVNGRNRRGVIRISDFYLGLAGAASYRQMDWRRAEDFALAAAVNGEVFRDEEGVFSEFRAKLMQGYPEEIRYLKLAEAASRFAQAIQYNYPRMLRRGDILTAHMMAWDGVKEAMKLQHYIEGKYPPHDKWLRRSLEESEAGREVTRLLDKIAGELRKGEKEAADSIEELGAFLALEMYGKGFISDTDAFLDAHREELLYKASLAAKKNMALVEEIAGLEFEAFDKVHNEGGRASCQDDWGTFSIMRKSQYMTWSRQMLEQYLYDFYREYHRGHNLIEEKYGRMMESTTPDKYEELLKEFPERFPELSGEKKAIIEQIVKLQVGWMEEFAANYPELSYNARSIHTSEDTPDNTSYETYLRGELMTYSDKMLELYGRYVVEYAREGRNLAKAIMNNNVKMYGYVDVDDAEEKIARSAAKE